jgi:hypothetical protein
MHSYDIGLRVANEIRAPARPRDVAPGPSVCITRSVQIRLHAAVCAKPYDNAAAESCKARQLGVTQVPDPCMMRDLMRTRERFALGFRGRGLP